MKNRTSFLGLAAATILMAKLNITFAGEILPTVPALIKNMEERHPYVNVLGEKNQQLGFKLESARSEFDPRVEQDLSGRVLGYYDGSSAAQRFVQPIAEMNAEVIGEYRIGTGDFPVYEEEYETLSRGEANVGVALSLLQNRKVDKRRVGVRNAQLAIQQYQSDIALQMNEFLYKGLSHYLKWYEVSLKVEAVNSLLETLKIREDGIATRVKRGDLAQVVLTEFEAIRLEQQLTRAQLYQAQRTAAQALAFYWRDQQGKALVVNGDASLPEDIQWPFSVNHVEAAKLRTALLLHPSLAVLRTEQQIMQNKYRLAENQLLPKLDLKALVAQDIGSGSETLEDTEGKVGLTFSYTLGNRKARAEQHRLNSELKVIGYEFTLAQDQINQQFEQAFVFWQQASEVLALQKRNADLAVLLSELERKRFDAGDSDMLKLNVRESNVLKAKLKAIEAQVTLLSAELALHRVAAAITG